MCRGERCGVWGAGCGDRGWQLWVPTNTARTRVEHVSCRMLLTATLTECTCCLVPAMLACRAWQQQPASRPPTWLTFFSLLQNLFHLVSALAFTSRILSAMVVV